MSRLPTPGSDDGTWGDILNDFLNQAHNGDGSLKSIDPTKVSGTAVVTADSRLSDSRTPLAHAASHLSSGPDPIDDPKLYWSPPALSNPTVMTLAATGGNDLTLDNSTDYILQMPASAMTGSGSTGCIKITGGRNIVLIGGEINLDNQGASPTQSQRRALGFFDCKGTVHIEGLWIHGDIGDCMEIYGSSMNLQIQNFRVDNISARDEVGFTDNHPDLIFIGTGTPGGINQLRVDRFTGSSDYQGLTINGQPSSVTVRRMDITAKDTPGSGSKQLLWQNSTSYPIYLSDFWVKPYSQPSNSNGQMIHPASTDADPTIRPAVQTDGSYVYPPKTSISGKINFGVPTVGNFVGAGGAGTNPGLTYVSPGYRSRDQLDAATPTTPLLVDPSINGYQAWNFDPIVSSHFGTPASGTVYLQKLLIQKTLTISFIQLACATVGSGLTSGSCLMGIYSSAGALLATSGDMSSAWSTTANSQKTATLTTPITITGGSGVFVWTAFICTGSVMPTFLCTPALNGWQVNINLNPGGVQRFAVAATGQTTLPGPLTVANNLSTAFAFWAAMF